MSRQLIPPQRLHQLKPTRPKRTFAPPARTRTIGIEEFRALTGLDLFPDIKVEA